MTDIHKAIADLRDAINRGEGWPTIHNAHDALETVMLEGYGATRLMGVFHNVEWWLERCQRIPDQWEGLKSALTALERAVTGDDMDSRIQAAAEEIRSVSCVVWDKLPEHHWLKDADDKLAAIIAALKDKEIGYEAALTRGNQLAKAGAGLFHEIDELMGDTDPIENDDATLACQDWWKALNAFETITAQSKLDELRKL